MSSELSLSLEHSMPIINVAAYKFFRWDRLEKRRDELKSLCYRLQLRGTILLSGEGINLFLAGSRESVDDVLVFLQNIPEVGSLQVKESVTDYQPFNRMLVKLKREIIPVGMEGIEPVESASPKMSPQELKRWLDEGRPVSLLDTRNDYEVELGTFEKAIDLRLKTFREFPTAAMELSQEVKENPVVMFCTGGIRCEKIGPYMKGLGFNEIYQLDGGILKYFEECDHAHFRGDCFVFDQRVSVNSKLAECDHSECFACKHVLTPEDLLSEKFVAAKSCPYCFRTPEEEHKAAISKRQKEIHRIALLQKGCVPYENRRWISIPRRSAGLPLIEALAESYPGYSRDQWQNAIDSGELGAPIAIKESLQTKKVCGDQIVREGERFLQKQMDYVEPPINPSIELVYEDSAIVVLNKSAPLPMHPSGRFNLNTLETILCAVYYPDKLRPSHRLDSHTTGLVVFGRKFVHSQFLQEQFKSGGVEKLYVARVLGDPEWDNCECDLPIGDEPLRNGGRAISASGLRALTRFVVRERLADGFSMVEAIPVTGRTHQIRLHLAALGFPIANDPLYLVGGATREMPDEHLRQSAMGLHAEKLAFTHPVTKLRVEFKALHPPA
jgi:RluA family pseudouridine synthase